MTTCAVCLGSSASSLVLQLLDWFFHQLRTSCLVGCRGISGDRRVKMVRVQRSPRVGKSNLMSGIKQSLLLVVPGGLLPLLFVVSSSIVEARMAHKTSQ